MGWNDHFLDAGEDETDIETCKHGKRYDFKTGEAIDPCPDCQRENG